MNDLFWLSFSSMFTAIMQVFLIAVIAGILVRKKIVNQDHIKGLSVVTVNVLLPCLIFTKITNNLDPTIFPTWWLVPLSASFMVLTGIGTGALLFIRKLPQKKNLLPLGGMQNAAYLVLPIGAAVYPNQFDEFALYNFLYVLGISPLVWSLGKFLITPKGSENKISYKDFISPPFLANVSAILLVLIGTRQYVPEILNNSMVMLGDATVPIATFILGATLGSVSLKKMPPMNETIKLLLIKFILLPTIVITLLYWLKIPPKYDLLTDLLVIQSASAPATAIILQVKSYGGDYEKTASIMFLSYIVCIISLPLWIALWNIL